MKSYEILGCGGQGQRASQQLAWRAKRHGKLMSTGPGLANKHAELAIAQASAGYSGRIALYKIFKEGTNFA